MERRSKQSIGPSLEHVSQIDTKGVPFIGQDFSLDYLLARVLTNIKSFPLVSISLGLFGGVECFFFKCYIVYHTVVMIEHWIPLYSLGQFG
jgi:hypothetical protein